MPKKKKFIDKKKAVTFHLVHRSQRDPLIADETAPQHVLVPATAPKRSKSKKDIEEEQKYGIYFDDDYNYLQHLRDAKPEMEWVETPNNSKSKSNPKFVLPSSAFASNVEEEVGLLNKAAPQSGLRLDLDPDVVAAMDDDFDYSDPENMLEDDFIQLANQPVSESEAASDQEDCYEENDYDDEVEYDSNFSDELEDEVGSLNNDAKSRFTEYSMTSSIISRNSQLTLLDETFEHMYSGYDETEIGALDCDEIEGDIDMDSQLVQMAKEEFEKAKKMEKLNPEKDFHYTMDSSDENSLVEEYLQEIKEKEKWDCESILSTYSNIYNHPKLIKEPNSKIRINEKTGMPIEIDRLTKKALSQLDDSAGKKGPASVLSTLSMLSIRDKNETLEEKKKRKQQLKEYRKIRRAERKANTQAFKDEKKKLERIMANNNLNHQGIKL